MEEKKNKGGLKKGQTNNPYGRPVGSKNKVKHGVKEKLARFMEDDIENFIHEIDRLQPRDKVKAKLEIIKLLVPRPMADEEKEGVNKLYGGLAHLFGKTEEWG